MTGRADGAGRVVQRRLAATVLDEQTGAQPPVSLDVSWHDGDPWVLTALFESESGPGVCWSWSVELLVAGRVAAAGIGDVRVGPRAGSTLLLEVVLDTADGRAVVLLERGEIDELLDEITLGFATDLGAGGQRELLVGQVSGWVDGLDAELAWLLLDETGHPGEHGRGGETR